MVGEAQTICLGSLLRLASISRDDEAMAIPFHQAWW
jgi:hypothetical protein